MHHDEAATPSAAASSFPPDAAPVDGPEQEARFSAAPSERDTEVGAEGVAGAVVDERTAAAPTASADAVSITALVLALLQLSVPAALLAVVAIRGATRAGLRSARPARVALILACVEFALAVIFWIAYFAVLAPIVALPR